MITEIVSNAADAVNIISIFFIRMVFTAAVTAPLILFSAAISHWMKAPRRYAYRMWCMTGAATLLLIVGSLVSMLPPGMVSQLTEGAASYTDVQKSDVSAAADGDTDLQDEKSAVLGTQASGSKISGSADITVGSEAADGKSSMAVSGDYRSASSSDIHDEQSFKQYKVISSAFSAAARVSSLEADLTSGKYGKFAGAAGELYITAAFLMIFINAARYVSLRRKLKTACLVKREDNSSAAGSGRLKNSKIKVFESSDIAAPFTLGAVRSAVFIPVGMDRVQTDNVLRHELAHTARRDQLKMSAAVFIASVLWFDPLVWFAVSMFRRDMELSCDDIAVKDMDSEARRSYAKVLLEAAPVGAVRYGSAVFMSDKRYFESRVMNILNNDKGGNNAGAKSRRTAAVAVSAVLCAVVLVAGGVVLSAMHLYSYGEDKGNDNNVGLDENLAKLTKKGITVNAVMIDADGNVIASTGDTEISVAPGSAASPLVAAVLMEDDPDCMEMEVPSDGFTLSDGSHIKNWLQGYHDGKDITLRQAFSEMSNTGKEYAAINADDMTVEQLKELYTADEAVEDINEDITSVGSEWARVKLAAGQYDMKLEDLAGAMLKLTGDGSQKESEDKALDTQQRAELRKIFRESLGWYFQYRADNGYDYYHLSEQQCREAAQNVMISASFGLSVDDGIDNKGLIHSVCAGYGAYNGKPVYFAVHAASDPLSSAVPPVYGEVIACRLNNIFLPEKRGDAQDTEYYSKSMSFDISAIEPYKEVTAWDELELNGGDELVFSGTWTPDAAKVKLKMYMYNEGSGAYEAVYDERTVEQGKKCRIPVNDDGKYRIDLYTDYPVSGGTLVLSVK